MNSFDANRLHQWDRADLSRRLCHALEIAERVVEHLAPTGYVDAEDPNNTLRPEKVISETAFLLYGAATAGHLNEVNSRIARVAERLVPHARSKRVLFAICLQPTLALDYAQAHVCLSRLGYGDTAVDRLIERSLRAETHHGRERPPHRMLEQEWIARTWKPARSLHKNTVSSSARISVLNQTMDVLSASREDVYAFTHALMYVRDFNRRPHRLPRARTEILGEAEAVLARCLDDQDYDLGGELLLSWPLTGKSWSSVASFAFKVLARVEDEAGFLPGPTTRLDRLAKLQGTDRTDYLLATAYHTAYVMGLLCAAALQTGRTPPTSIAVNRPTPGSAGVILKYLTADQDRPHWHEDFAQLDTGSQDSIAGLLLTIALRRKVRRRDFRGIHELLKCGSELGLADGPASRQAAELLERISGTQWSNAQKDTPTCCGPDETAAVPSKECCRFS